MFRWLVERLQPPDVDALAERWGVSPAEVEFLISAIGSWQLRRTVLRGAQVSYDAELRAVFRALDPLHA